MSTGGSRFPVFARTAFAVRSHAWAMVALVALAVTSHTIVFALVNAAVLTAIPYPESGRIVHVTKLGANDLSVVFDAEFLLWQRELEGVATLSAYATADTTLRGGTETERVRVLRATASFFEVFRLAPVQGRFFTSSEVGASGAQRVALLSASCARRILGSDFHGVGQTITLDGLPHVVIGVLPEAFRLPDKRQVDVMRCRCSGPVAW